MRAALPSECTWPLCTFSLPALPPHHPLPLQEHNYLYALPAAALIAALAAARYTGYMVPVVASGVYLISSALCIASIACLSHQATARTGEQTLPPPFLLSTLCLLLHLITYQQLCACSAKAPPLGLSASWVALPPPSPPLRALQCQCWARWVGGVFTQGWGIRVGG